MDQIISFVRKNAFLIVIVLILFGVYSFLQKQKPVFLNSISQESPSMGIPSQIEGFAFDKEIASDIAVSRVDQYAPQANVENRLVIQNSYISLLVEDAKKVRDAIVAYTTSVGGYMVSSDMTGESESVSATVSVRVPQKLIDDVLQMFRSYAIRVVSEHLDGYDVTDQYIDVEKRIQILKKTMEQYEALRDQSREISDLTEITREILNIQSQIDRYVGQQESLKQNSEFVKITIYLSTDEIALPFQPDDNFRPEVIVKLAIRSLVTTLRSGLSTLIWIGVYGVIWIPLLVIGFILYQRIKK